MGKNLPAHILRWLLDLEASGNLEAVTAVVVTKEGDVKLISIGNPTPINLTEMQECANS